MIAAFRLLSLLLACALYAPAAGALQTSAALAPSALSTSGRDHVVARAWLEDTDGGLDFEQVRERPFAPYDGLLVRGYSRSAFWLRLRIDPAPDPDPDADPGPGPGRATGPPSDTLVLRIRPAFLDEIRLFDPLAPDGPPRTTGARYRWIDDGFRSVNLNFVVPRGDAPRDVWLRLRTSSSSMIAVQALSPADADALDHRQEFVYLSVLALLLMTVGAALVQWIAGREALVGLYLLKQCAGVAYALAMMGYLRVFLDGVLSPIDVDRIALALFVAAPAAGLLFHYRFLRELQAPGWGLMLLKLNAIPALVVVMHLAADQPMSALRTVAATGLVDVLLFAAIAARARVWRAGPSAARPLVPRGLVLGVYALHAVVALVSVPAALGLLPGAEYLLALPILGVLISGVPMLVLLQVRARAIVERDARSLAMLAHSEARARREREHREDRERLLSMLAHELRTPLASVRMLLSSGVPGPQDLDRVDRCIADMSSVIERCIETGRLDERQPSVAVATCEVDSALHALRDAQRRPERVRLECDPLPPVRTDPQLLRIVLGNLLDNALKYAPPQATVRIAASPAPRAGMDGIEIAIENPPGDAGWPDPRQVFGKYYRAPKARRQTGSGLGLYLVSGLAGRLGGDVRYAPDDTVVRFVLWLPV